MFFSKISHWDRKPNDFPPAVQPFCKRRYGFFVLWTRTFLVISREIDNCNLHINALFQTGSRECNTLGCDGMSNEFDEKSFLKTNSRTKILEVNIECVSSWFNRRTLSGKVNFIAIKKISVAGVHKYINYYYCGVVT